MVVNGRPKPPKIQLFWGSPSPKGSYSAYILGDTTRPGHVTCVLVWSKSDRRRLRKTLHKQTNKQTDRQTDTTKIMVTWPWTNKLCYRQYFYRASIQHSYAECDTDKQSCPSVCLSVRPSNTCYVSFVEIICSFCCHFLCSIWCLCMFIAVL